MGWIRRLFGRRAPRVDASLSVAVTGITLRTRHREGRPTTLEVLFQSGGRWHKIMEYATEHEGVIAHTTHLLGLVKALSNPEPRGGVRHEMDNDT